MHDHPAAASGLAPPDPFVVPNDGPAAAIAAIPATDGERLMRFYRHRDQGAFAEVVEAHAAMVWGVCSAILRHRQDVEDAFQATFLILARKARAIRAADSAAGWLYRVAFRTALLARHRRGRRMEQPLVEEPLAVADQLAAVQRSEHCFTLLEELHALPEQLRQPLVLCYLEGRSRSEAAHALGVTSQTVKGRLARGIRMLRTRLVRRGVALSTTMGFVTAATATAQTASPTLAVSLASLAAGFAWKLAGAAQTTATAQAAAACSLAEKGLLAMTLAATAKPAAGLLAACLVAGSLALANADGPAATLSSADGALLVVAAQADGDAATDDAAVEISAATDESPISDNPEEEVPTTAEYPSDSRGEAGSADAAPTRSNEPADVLVPAPPGATTIAAARQPLVIEDREIDARLREFAAQIRPFGLPTSTLAPADHISVETLKLETEYWDLKANGLKKKAEAIRMKAERTRRQQELGTGPAMPGDAVEFEAEAELTLAEVKLCKVNAQRLKDAIAAKEKQAKDQAEGKVSDVLRQRLSDHVVFEPMYRPVYEQPANMPNAGASGGGGRAAALAPPVVGAVPPTPPVRPQTIKIRSAAPVEVNAAVAKEQLQEAEKAAKEAHLREAAAADLAERAKAARWEAEAKLMEQLDKLQAEKAKLEQQLKELKLPREAARVK